MTLYTAVSNAELQQFNTPGASEVISDPWNDEARGLVCFTLLFCSTFVVDKPNSTAMTPTPRDAFLEGILFQKSKEGEKTGLLFLP